MTQKIQTISNIQKIKKKDSRLKKCYYSFPCLYNWRTFMCLSKIKKMQFRYKKFLPKKRVSFSSFLSKNQKMIRKFILRIFPCRALEAQMMASKWVLTNWGLWKSIYNYCTNFYFNPIMHTYYFRDCLPIFRLAVDFYVQMLYLKILRISIALLRIFLYHTLYLRMVVQNMSL